MRTKAENITRKRELKKILLEKARTGEDLDEVLNEYIAVHQDMVLHGQT